MKRLKNQIDWKNILDEWQETQSPVSSFCKEHQVPKASFYYWRDRLGSKDSGKSYKKTKRGNTRTAFVPIELNKEDEQKSQRVDEIALYYPNGCYLKLREGCNLKLLRAINEIMGCVPC